MASKSFSRSNLPWWRQAIEWSRHSGESAVKEHVHTCSWNRRIIMPLSSPLKFLYEIRVVGIPYTQYSTQLLTLDAVWRIVIPSELLIWAGLSFYRAFSWNLPFYRGFCSFFDDYEMTGSAVPIWNDKSQPPTWIGRRIVCLRDLLACYIINCILLFLYCLLYLYTLCCVRVADVKVASSDHYVSGNSSQHFRPDLVHSFF